MEDRQGLRASPEDNYNLVKLLNQMFTNSANPGLPRVHLPMGDLSNSPPALPPQYFSLMKFSGYKDEISAVVAKTFDNSPRTADSVRTLLTPRYPPRQEIELQFPTSSYYTNSTSRDIEGSTQSTWPRSTLTSTDKSTWPQYFTSSAPEVTFSDLSLNFSRTPRPAKSARSFPVTPRTSRSENYGVDSNLTQEELRHHKLNERPLPTPHSSLLLPGRDENGVHIPYLELPATSRENTMVNYHELLNSLLTSYNSSTGPPTIGPPGDGAGRKGAGAMMVKGEERGKNGGKDDVSNGKNGGATGETSSGWSRKEKMLCLALVCVLLVVVLMVVVVVLLAIGVGNQDNDKAATINLIGVPAAGINNNNNNNNNKNISSSAPDPGIVNTGNTTFTPPTFSSTQSLTSAATKTTTTTANTNSKTSRPPTTASITTTTANNIITPDSTTKQPQTSTTTKSGTTVPKHTSSTTITFDDVINGDGGTIIRMTTPAGDDNDVTQRTSTQESISDPNNIIIFPIEPPPTIQTTTTTPNDQQTTTTTTNGLIIVDKTIPLLDTTQTTTKTSSSPPTQKTTTTPATTTVTSTTTTTTTSTTTTTTTTTTTLPTTTTTTATLPTTTTTTATLPTTTTTTQDPLSLLVDKECATPKCQEFADLIMTSQNASASPCTKFYEYSCGSVDQSESVNSDVALTSLQRMVTNDLYQIASDSLDKPIDSDAGGISRLFYQACLASNQDEDKVKALDEVTKILNHLGLTSTLTSTLSLDLVLRRLQDAYDLGPFFRLRRVPEFDGFQYTYVLRMAATYVEAITDILMGVVDGGRGGKRRKRRSGDQRSDWKVKGHQGQRQRRQSGLERQGVKVLVEKVLGLDWALAGILPDQSTPPEDLLVQSVSIRSLQAQIPIMPWGLLTELSVIDNIQVQSSRYVRDLNGVLASHADVITLYCYVRLVVEMLPYMPHVVRRDLGPNGPGASQIYSNKDCAGLAFRVIPDDVINTMTQGQGLRSQEQAGISMAEEAKADLQRVFGSFRGIPAAVRTDVLNDLQNLQVVLPYPSPNQGVVLDDPSASLLVIAMEIKERQTAILSSTSQGSVNEKPLLYSDLDPAIQTADVALQLPVSLVHLSAWVEGDSEFLVPFYKSLIYRTLLDYVIKRHVYTPEFASMQSCWIRDFPFLASYEDPRASIAILVEAATLEILYEGRSLPTNTVVQLGQSYFYQSQLVYAAYIQPMCRTVGDIQSMDTWPGSIPPGVLLTSIFSKHYKGTRMFGCTLPSCFFWSQSLFGEGQ